MDAVHYTFGRLVTDMIYEYVHRLKMAELNKEFHQKWVYVENFGNLWATGLIPNPHTYSDFSEKELACLLMNFRDLNSISAFIYGHPVIRAPDHFYRGDEFWHHRWLLPKRF